MIRFLISKFDSYIPWRIKGFLTGRPKGISTIFSLAKQDRIIHLSYDGTFKLKKPIIFNSHFHNVFNENLTYPTEVKFILSLKQARIYRKNHVFSIINNENNIIKEVSLDPLKRNVHPVFTHASRIIL